jgi:N-acetylmuramoyl-L-alanine amidase
MDTHISIRPSGCVEAVINDPDHYTNVRNGPGLEHGVVTRLIEGEVFCVTSQEGRWWRVSTGNGLTGYIYYDRVRVRH